MTLVLWDIDGTLVDVHGNGRRAFALAIERTWGVVDELSDVKFAGATDLGILAQVRTRLALDPVHEQRFFDVMHDALHELLAKAPASALPGALDVVTALHARGAQQGLVTGNGKRCAYVKIRSAGLHVDHFPFGGFGDEHHDRDELAVRALGRAPKRAQRTVLVGDTPSDVRAAKRIGAVAIAVICRAYDRAALSAAGADVVVDSLHEVLPIVDAA